MTAVLADTIPGIRVVKAFAQEHREIDRFRQTNDRVLATNDRVNTLWSFFGATVTLLTDLGLAVVWVVAVWRIFQHHMTLGVLQVFVDVRDAVLWPAGLDEPDDGRLAACGSQRAADFRGFGSHADGAAAGASCASGADPRGHRVARGLDSGMGRVRCWKGWIFRFAPER